MWTANVVYFSIVLYNRLDAYMFSSCPVLVPVRASPVPSVVTVSCEGVLL